MILLAPNGKPSNLTPEQYRLVRSEEFIAWFGNWEKLAYAKLKDSAMDEVTMSSLSKDVSKIVDENGEPLVVHHSGNKGINVFDKRMLGSRKSRGEQVDIGFYFGNKMTAELFIRSEHISKTYSVFLNIKNPYYVDVNQEIREYAFDGEPEIIEAVTDIWSGKTGETLNSAVDFYDFDSQSVNERAIESNSDGFIIKGADGSFIYNAFEPNQIKLADGSNTIFDGSNPDIRFGDGGEVDKETYKKWKSLVNMSKGELEKFYDSPEGKDAGLSPREANEKGIDSGRESARWIMKMKDVPYSEWTPTMWKWAKKQISFISRMRGNKGSLYDNNGNKTRKHTSLLIWGHNPKKNKFDDGGEVEDIYYHASNSKFQNFALINNKTYKEFDIPSWFFTKDIDYAKSYGRYLYSVKLNVKNTFDVSKKGHYDLFINGLKEFGYGKNKINEVLDEQFYNGLPYWTCDDAFYVAKANGFDSILIQEELDKEVLSVAVFDVENIEIIKVQDVYSVNSFDDGGVLTMKKPIKKLTSEDIINSEEFIAWFGDWKTAYNTAGLDFKHPAWKNVSKAVDDDGRPLKLYHGTTHEWTKYSRKLGNHGNDMGIGFYATSSLSDAMKNYLHGGSDLKNRLSITAEHIQYARDISFERAKKIAEKRIIGDTERVIEVYLNIKKPLIIATKGWSGTNFDFAGSFDDETEQYEDSKDFIKFKDAFDAVSDDFVFTDKVRNLIWSQFMENIGEPDYKSAYQVIQALKRSDWLDEETYNDVSGGNEAHEFVAQVFRKLGFDGVIYLDASEHFKNMGILSGTKHMIAFKPTQIKLADGSNKTFDPKNADIRFHDGGKVTFIKKEETEKEHAHTNVYLDGKYLGYYMRNDSPFAAKDENWNFVSKDVNYPNLRAKTQSELVSILGKEKNEQFSDGGELVQERPEPKFQIGQILNLKGYGEVKVIDFGWLEPPLSLRSGYLYDFRLGSKFDLPESKKRKKDFIAVDFALYEYEVEMMLEDFDTGIDYEKSYEKYVNAGIYAIGSPPLDFNRFIVVLNRSVYYLQHPEFELSKKVKMSEFAKKYAVYKDSEVKFDGGIGNSLSAEWTHDIVEHLQGNYGSVINYNKVYGLIKEVVDKALSAKSFDSFNEFIGTHNAFYWEANKVGNYRNLWWSNLSYQLGYTDKVVKDEVDEDFMSQVISIMDYAIDKRQDEEEFSGGGSVNEESDSNQLDYWEKIYNENVDVQNRMQYGFSEKSGRQYGTAEFLSPKYKAIAEYCVIVLKNKGYEYSVYSIAKSGTIYVYIYGIGSSPTIRISDHEGRGDVFSVKYDISTLREAKVILDKIITRSEADEINRLERVNNKIEYNRVVDFKNHIKEKGLGYKVNYRTYQSSDDFSKKHPEIKFLKSTELGSNRFGEMAYKHEYLSPIDSYSTTPPIDYIEWYNVQHGANDSLGTPKFNNGGNLTLTKDSVITFDNFHLGTYADFIRITKSELPDRNPDFVSESGSKYWYYGDYVCRQSDHWGNLGSCTWLLNSNSHNKLSQGRCKLSLFKKNVNSVNSIDVPMCNKLYKDHHEVWDKLSDIEKKVCETNCVEYSSNIVSMWYAELKNHFEEEEKDLFPSIRNEENKYVINELILEHKHIVKLIDKIKSGNNTSDILEFCNFMKYHIKKEENLMSNITPDPYKK